MVCTSNGNINGLEIKMFLSIAHQNLLSGSYHIFIISDKMERLGNDLDIGDVGCEYEKDGNCEDTEADTDERHGDHGKTGEAEQRHVT
jgi:hypothetical protein